MRLLLLLATLFAVNIAPGCDEDGDLVGSWGGDHIALVVSDEAATVEFDCAVGTLSAPLHVDAEGRLEVQGTFTAQQGGPSRTDDPARPETAHYSGQRQGDTLTLSVTLPERGVTLGPFTLTRNAAPRLYKCV